MSGDIEEIAAKDGELSGLRATFESWQQRDKELREALGVESEDHMDSLDACRALREEVARWRNHFMDEKDRTTKALATVNRLQEEVEQLRQALERIGNATDTGDHPFLAGGIARSALAALKGDKQ